MARKGGVKYFDPIKITQCGYQSGAQRYPESQPPPEVAAYRNSLVAFSQYYNLCFVASLDTILVHAPIYLDQTLLPPRSTINIASSNTGLRGYIDPGHPHSINHLVVADLGLEELVIAVTDDGDVVAYATRSIRNEINHHGSAYNTPAFHSVIKPYFLRNVGKSAWGVAVHQEARLIAVSCNSTKIHVFAFALGDPSSSSSDEASDHQDVGPDLLDSLGNIEWVHVIKQNEQLLDDRSLNLEIVLEEHQANIPNVVFYNPFQYDRRTGDVFLVSTDINGVTNLWSVQQRSIIVELMPDTSPYLHGWGLACIDPFYARQTKSTCELFGAKRGIFTNKMFTDTTDALPHVPGYESNHFTKRDRMKIAGEAPTNEVIDNDDDEALHDDEDDDEDLELEYSWQEPGADFWPLLNGHNFATGAAELSMPPVTPSPMHATPQTSAIKPQGVKSMTFLILHTTRTDARLLQMLKIHTKDIRPVKAITCRSILDQDVHHMDRYLKRLQRLNTVHHVPELGIVIIGDQMGRVAILTITRRPCNANNDKDKSGSASLDDVGFRVEGFLPFTAQEDAGQRPKTDLLGVAVGPVQGHEREREDLLDEATGVKSRRGIREKGRPWRVMLYYWDHTVLSYEIRR
ncbi:MAG: hypothetical protein Q9171_004270 [Xanthocarpia ochracea]